jgi:hypothetical protein
MDRRRTSLVLLLLFVACTGAAIVVSGTRPGLHQGVAPTVVQVVGYLFALAAAVLLIVPSAARRDSSPTLGFVLLGGLGILVAMEFVSRGGTDIGAGGVRLIGLVVIGVATVRLAQSIAARRTQ